jgi:hypothetical protein
MSNMRRNDQYASSFKFILYMVTQLKNILSTWGAGNTVDSTNNEEQVGSRGRTGRGVVKTVPKGSPGHSACGGGRTVQGRAIDASPSGFTRCAARGARERRW